MLLQNSTPHQDTASVPPHRYPKLHINVVVQSPLQLTIGHTVFTLLVKIPLVPADGPTFTILGKDNNLLVTFYRVFTRPPVSHPSG
jgi:hypothetical protein